MGVVRPDRFALAAAGVTAALSFSAAADAPGSAFILGACLFWAVFVVVRTCQDRQAFHQWGFRSKNLGRAAAASAALFVVGAAGLAFLGALQGTFQFPLHALPLFVVYTVWGLIQQFLMLGVFAGNLERLAVFRQRKALLVVFVACVFGLLHAFNLKLVAATFLLELAIVPLYLRHRNLWPLGVLHGWLGGLFYLWVEGRDLWVERFG